MAVAGQDATERTPLLDDRDADSHSKDRSSDSPQMLSQAKIATILAASWVGVFLGALDTTVVATLVAPISSSFESGNHVSWLGTSYLLAIATTTPLYGKMSDITGRRAVMLLALGLFGIGTLLCGLSSSMGMLIAARTLAGCGGGGIMALSSIIASDIVPLKKRGLIQGIVNIFYGLGSGIGAPLGGFIVSRSNWRSAFLIQVPFLLLAWVLVFIFVRYKLPTQVDNKAKAMKQVDWLGSATLVVCISGLLLGLSWKNNEGYEWKNVRVWGSALAFLLGLAAFIGVEAKVAANPVMPLRILSHRSPICIALSNFLFSMLNFSILYYYPIFFESVQLLPPSKTGYHLVPLSIALSIGSLGAGYIMRRTGKYYYLNLTLAFLPSLGSAAMALMTSTPRWTDWANPFLTGIGAGGNVTALLIALLANVNREDMAVATGISYLFRYCGQVVGVGVAGGVLQGILTSQLKSRLDDPELINRIRKVSSSIPELPPHIRDQAVASYAVALRWVFLLNMGLALLNFGLSLFIEEHPLPGSFDEEAKLAKDREERRSRENGQRGA